MKQFVGSIIEIIKVGQYIFYDFRLYIYIIYMTKSLKKRGGWGFFTSSKTPTEPTYEELKKKGEEEAKRWQASQSKQQQLDAEMEEAEELDRLRKLKEEMYGGKKSRKQKKTAKRRKTRRMKKSKK